MDLTVFTDGSHFKINNKSEIGRLGIGGVILNDKRRRINQFSMEISRKYLEFNYGTQNCSNPTMELLAVLFALHNFKGNINPIEDTVTFKADYIGVSKWLNKEWKVKETHIARIFSDIQQTINRMGLKGKVKFEWVKGHQRYSADPDAYWNNYVDKLAKGEIK
jgi:ribonuclease HI